MITGLFKGFGYIFTGLSLITQKGIRPFVLVPLLINTVLFAGGIWLAKSQLEYWMAHLLPSWLSWLEWLLWPIFAVLIFFVVFYVFTLVANILAAPFNAVLAEKVEARLNGQPIPEFAGYKSLPALITRTFRSELSKLWYMGKWFVLLLILTVIPGVNIVAPVAWTLFGAWMLAIEYADYPMGNHNLFFKDELAALKKNRAEALGFGWLLSLMTVVPVLNFLSMPVGVAGGTALWVKKLSKTV
ncbi:MAG TPA: sulfate transporter CysZ [Candidatus Thiothrix moscowensis]|uniref:sulfate transporter CysZ n=1 Tax=unclassified Thiothrix TaxID=2636184 RepID=UPI0025EF7089|nr:MULTISPECIES: sulfate transporter CysZ [unclassified Thiothrix]HRJ53401.1 sulfate transporter CysZ [Candidatus Thiothrix moscowensis]HRJ94622.1 sulfate transporter CysZ [Candidatus Thiothrix moscowensis]